MSCSKTNLKTAPAFTIVETLLSMAGISFMILVIGYVILQIINIYQKGISIKDVNKTADLIIRDIQGSINGSSSVVCAIKQANIDSMKVVPCSQIYDSTKVDQITGGAFCTDTNSYVWNYGPAIQRLSTIDNPVDRNDETKKLFRYSYQPGQSRLIRLAKINDASAAYCQNKRVTGFGTSSGERSVMSVDDSQLADKTMVTELIEANDRELALHSFVFTNRSADDSTNQALYEMEFVLGTFKDKLLVTEDAKCKTLKQAQTPKYRPDGTIDQSEFASEFDLSYCAINKFNFAARGLKGKGKW